MLLILNSLALFITSLCLAEAAEPTIFVWKPDQKRAYKGRCYEIDSKTYGQIYTVNASTDKCKPEQTTLIWVPLEGKPFGGRCYLVDRETSGQKYSKYTTKENCYPKNKRYIWQTLEDGKGFCFLVDEETGGGEFVDKVDKVKCKVDKVTYTFVVRQRGAGGTCYEVGVSSDFRRKVEIEKCKPEGTSFKWIAKSPTTGTCFEVAAEGPSVYSNRVKLKECLEKNYKLSWKPTDDGLSGTCLKVFQTFDGQTYMEITSADSCKPKKLVTKFVRINSIKGKCVQVDEETEGQVFSKTIPIEKCRPKETFFNSTKLGRVFRCYELDTATSGAKYIAQVATKKCSETLEKPKWYPSPANPWVGKCKSLELVEGKQKFTNQRDKFCKPSKTTFIWHNTAPFAGYCYMIDALKGPSFFASPVEAKFCKTEKMKFKIHLHMNKKRGTGTCYKVDAETMGKRYFLRMGNKKCKNDLLFKEDPLEKIELPWDK